MEMIILIAGNWFFYENVYIKENTWIILYDYRKQGPISFPFFYKRKSWKKGKAKLLCMRNEDKFKDRKEEAEDNWTQENTLMSRSQSNCKNKVFLFFCFPKKRRNEPVQLMSFWRPRPLPLCLLTSRGGVREQVSFLKSLSKSSQG